jgi:uncharacterized protein involved in tolerance to divalent cations
MTSESKFVSAPDEDYSRNALLEWVSEWMSNCLIPYEKIFSYISWREQVTFDEIMMLISTLY